jgi:putative hydrolase of the HAD superfamily
MRLYRVLFLDLDDTLYPPETGLWKAIRDRIQRYLTERMGFSQAEAERLRGQYLGQYGTTLEGLRRHHRVDVEDYLQFVHNVPIESALKPDPALRALLERIRARKVIFTNASLDHTKRVARALGIEGVIDQYIDIRALDFENKPRLAAYHRALQLTGNPPPPQCVMVEDRPVNLEPAKELGMLTVLVGARSGRDGRHRVIPSLHELLKAVPELALEGEDDL